MNMAKRWSKKGTALLGTLAVALGLSAGAAQAGGSLLPSFHGGASTVGDLSSLNTEGGTSGARVTSILSKGIGSFDGLVTVDPRTGDITEVSFDLSTDQAGVIDGIITVTVTNLDGAVVSTQSFDADGRVAFVEQWQRRYETTNLGDGDELRRRITHRIAITGSSPNARISLSARTALETSSRFSVAPYVGRLTTAVRYPASGSSSNVVSRGSSDVLLSGFTEDVAFWNIDLDSLTDVSGGRMQTWTADAPLTVGNPFTGPLGGDEAGEVRIATRWYNPSRSTVPGRYRIDYTGRATAGTKGTPISSSSRGVPFVLRQAGLLTATEAQGPGALFSNIYDTNYIASGPAGATRITSRRDSQLVIQDGALD